MTRIVLFTLQTALLSTACILPFGVAIAWLLARHRWSGKTVVETIVALPLVIPPVATGLILLAIFGRSVAFTWRAVVLAMMVMSFPLLVRTARVAFEEVSARLEQIARTLGANEPRVFFTITLPLAMRGVVAGAMLAFARALGEFGATIIVAGNIPGRTQTLSLAIYDHIEHGHDADAWRLLVVSIVIAFIAVWISERIVRREARA